MIIWSIDRCTGLAHNVLQDYMDGSIEARADRSLGQAKANLHSMVHVRLTETVRILRHCKPREEN
jgi:hypothetical protein